MRTDGNGLLQRPPIPASVRSSKACRCPVRCRPWLAPKPEMFNTGDVPPFTGCSVDPKLLRRVPYCLRHQAALENDPAKVLQMVEAGGGLRADELSCRDRAGQAVWGAWFDCEPRVRGVEGHRGQPGGRAPLRRHLAGRVRRAARAVRVAGLRPAEYNCPVDAPARGRTGGAR
jgi:hypothetical protein